MIRESRRTLPVSRKVRPNNLEHETERRAPDWRMHDESYKHACPGVHGLVDHRDNLLQPHDHWMHMALNQAQIGFEADEVPVGAVVVCDERIIAEAHNQRESLKDPTAHAEMIAITQAAEALGSWRLLDCALYVTLEPCPMCAGAIVQARIPIVVYGATDSKAGAAHSLYEITSDPRLNHQATVIGGVLAEKSRAILQEFFAQQRMQGKK